MHEAKLSSGFTWPWKLGIVIGAATAIFGLIGFVWRLVEEVSKPGAQQRPA